MKSITKASDPENNTSKRRIHIGELFNIDGSLSLAGGYLSDNQYGGSGFFTSVFFQPQIAVKGIPVDLTWNIIQPPHGPLQFGRFNLGFSKKNFEEFLKNQAADSLLHIDADSLLNYQEVHSKLSDFQYLKSVSESSREYRKLQADSLSGKEVFPDEIRMDSLRKVIAEYNALNTRFHQLKSANSSSLSGDLKKDSLQNTLRSEELKFSNSKGEAKSISDSLQKLEEWNNLSGIGKFLMRFDKISIGYDVLDYSRLSVIGYPYSGGALDYSYKGIITGFAVGKHAPYYSSTLFGGSGINFSNDFKDEANIFPAQWDPKLGIHVT